MGAVIHDEASRLATRLNDLLYLSELESGQALLERDMIDVRRLIETSVERIAPALALRNVRLDLDLADGLQVSADGPKLERALENLFDNARKYAPDGSAVRVRSTGDGESVRIEVANASEMAEDELPRLFERFYRSDRTRGGPAGSGLGLPIARDLVELHGGELTAALHDGEIVMTIRLPQA